MAGPREFDDKMERLANLIADKALGSETIDKELTDTFKALSSYQSSSRKLDKVLSPDEDPTGGGGFAGIRQRIDSAGRIDGAAKDAIEGSKRN